MTNRELLEDSVGLRYDFEEAFHLMAVTVEKHLASAPPVIRNYTAHLAKSTGKFIRAYGLMACSMDEEDKVPADAVTLASAVELLHLATLVHDDVIDDADTRRGIETLQKRFGKKAAVICGDYLLSLALKLASSIPQKNQYEALDMPNYLCRICMGELRQEINNGNLDLSVYRYLSIIKGKTAALFEASFHGGAMLSTKDERKLRMYRKAGNDVGMIFQLMDDCIDYEMEETEAKKNVRSDYEEGVVTLPLIHAMNQDESFSGQVKNGLVSAKELYTKVLEAGGTAYTKAVAGRYYGKASNTIGNLGLSEAKKARIMTVVDKSYYGIKK
ncbi:polyprenyl synthetase family protein [Lacrimispora saccharolytica]|uniref:Polyprenyl synthetase n=1 Tax=Lacrimispora saccharolytica (strain ATCC 35040 / DSM 2544 / NRCC 2533 / WM1) TaxID=610130 RepID=D9R3N1_LACSW|nr:polyprenyl synthetase family protein [Lacrimispora saccharolytica]ADL06752.1 Polyprenyl synthetase [[Clostridium] saccharolyticum WM1]QRV19182.1 polyprenyl synthetase family protein [Lacrimispora saccharolytica]